MDRAREGNASGACASCRIRSSGAAEVPGRDARPGLRVALGPGEKAVVGGLRAALEILGVEPSQAVMIGDQIFADVWAGKNGGVTTVLVDPEDPEKEFPSTRALRIFERGLRRRWAKELRG